MLQSHEIEISDLHMPYNNAVQLVPSDSVGPYPIDLFVGCCVLIIVMGWFELFLGQLG